MIPDSTTTSPSGSPWSLVDVCGVRLQVPQSWHVERPLSGDPAVLLNGPDTQGSGFQPTIVVRLSSGPAHPDISPLSSWSLASLSASWEGHGVAVSSDALHFGEHPARCQRFLARTGALEFLVDRVLVARPDSVVEITSTIPLVEIPRQGLALERIVYQADYTRPLTSPLPIAATPLALSAPALDPDLSLTFGAPLEDTRRMVMDQARDFSLSGPRVSTTSLRLLQSAGESGIGRLVAQSRSVEVSELQSAGLLDGHRLTHAAQELLTPYREQFSSLRFFAGRGPTGTHLHVWLGRDGTALLAAGPTPRDLLDGDGTLPESHSLTLVRVDNQSVPRFAVAWLGLGPSWRVDLSDAPLTVKELDRMRDTGRMVALTSSSAAARRCEGAPVLDVHLDQDDAQSVLSLIMIDGVGLFQPVPADDSAMTDASLLRLVTAGSRAVSDVIIGIVSQAVSEE